MPENDVLAAPGHARRPGRAHGGGGSHGGHRGGTGARSAERRGMHKAGLGLDWFNLFVANIQTGFGAFIAVYLTAQGWTETAIGVALSIGTITAMASQIPAGAVVDSARNKSMIAGVSMIAFCVSALLFAISPVPLSVYFAEILHGFSSCTLGPAIAAMSLAVAGRARFGPRLGRNTRFGSIGSGIGAAMMGACGYYISERAVFFLTALLTLPSLVPLIWLHKAVPAQPRRRTRKGLQKERFLALITGRLWLLAACAMLFTLANAAMLPLASSAVTKRAGDTASLFIAACIVLPQFIVALLSPAVGHYAEAHGRRSILLLGFAMLPLRGLLFMITTQPLPVVLIQTLDGIAGACFGVIIPLVTSDLTARSGHFNLSLGFVGFAIGIGGTLSTTAAGWIADRLGQPAAFAGLAATGLAAVLLVWTAMPETRQLSR
jgi:MFS family permease